MARPVGPTCLGRQQHVEAAAAPKVHHRLTGPQVGRGGRVPAAQPHVGLGGDGCQLGGRVAERLGDGVNAGVAAGQLTLRPRPRRSGGWRSCRRRPGRGCSSQVHSSGVTVFSSIMAGLRLVGGVQFRTVGQPASTRATAGVSSTACAEVAALQAERHADQPDQGGHLDQRADHGRERGTMVDAEHADRDGDGQLKVVARRGEGHGDGAWRSPPRPTRPWRS